MSRRITRLALALSCAGALAVPAGASAEWPSGSRACQAATPDCVQVVSEARGITSSWSRHTLTCPVGRSNAVTNRHVALGKGWDYQYTGSVEPDVDIVDVVPARVGRGAEVTLSIDSGYADALFAALRPKQQFRWAIGCVA